MSVNRDLTKTSFKIVESVRRHLLMLEIKLIGQEEDLQSWHTLLDVLSKHPTLRAEWDVFLTKIKMFEPDLEIVIPGEKEDSSE